MIALARSARVTAAMHRNAAASRLARQFVGGRNVAVAVATVLRLRSAGFRASLFHLGEYVSDPELVQQTVAQKIAVAEALARVGLDVHVSADPTQLGYMIDDAAGRANMLRVGKRPPQRAAAAAGDDRRLRRRARAPKSIAAKCCCLSNPLDAYCKFLYCSMREHRSDWHLGADIDNQFAAWTESMNTQFTIALNLVFSMMNMSGRDLGRPLAVLGATPGCR